MVEPSAGIVEIVNWSCGLCNKERHKLGIRWENEMMFGNIFALQINGRSIFFKIGSGYIFEDISE